MDGLTGLLAQLIAGLRGLVPPDVCPGGWPWAVSLLGIAVGLLPTAGLVVVAGLRKRIGSRYGFGRSTLLVGTGFCGALSTYSAFSYETLRLSQRGARWFAAGNVGLSLAAGVGAATLGWWLGLSLR